MNDNQKEFLNELGKLFNKYNIDTVCVGNADKDEIQDIEFWSNNQKLAFYKYAGYKSATRFDCENMCLQESVKAPVGVFSNVSTFFYEPEYYPEKDEE